jgi:hypothetical protein
MVQVMSSNSSGRFLDHFSRQAKKANSSNKCRPSKYSTPPHTAAQMSLFFGVKPGSMVWNLEVCPINTEETIIVFFTFVPVLKYDLKIIEC